MPITQFEDPTYLEAVYAALFYLLEQAKFAGNVKFQTSQRVVVVPDQIAPADQPTLVMVQGPLRAEQKEVFGPTKWTLTAMAVIYLQADPSQNPNPLPATLTNYLVWGIQTVLGLTAPPYSKQTLGGLVCHCWIEGEVLTEVAEQQVVVTIPIFILAGPVG